MAGYPKKEVQGAFGVCYVEMTPEEYEAALAKYRHMLDTSLDVALSKGQERYANYLSRWFSEHSRCDGYDSVSERIKFHRLPMSCNEYLFG